MNLIDGVREERAHRVTFCGRYKQGLMTKKQSKTKIPSRERPSYKPPQLYYCWLRSWVINISKWKREGREQLPVSILVQLYYCWLRSCVINSSKLERERRGQLPVSILAVLA